MQRQIEELKRKAEQGSQQLQGEALELELEAILRRNFPFDSVEPVPKGEFGGDLIQRVANGSGSACGTILWETKRTRNWSDGWLAKLRGDQRQAKADVALIVSCALPKSVENFGLIDGVWVTGPQCAVPVAIALRELLISVASARTAGEGQKKTKMELVYEYLTGPRFRHRIEAIVEQFTEMDLDRNAKLWSNFGRVASSRSEPSLNRPLASMVTCKVLPAAASKKLKAYRFSCLPVLPTSRSALQGESRWKAQ